MVFLGSSPTTTFGQTAKNFFVAEFAPAGGDDDRAQALEFFEQKADHFSVGAKFSGKLFVSLRDDAQTPLRTRETLHGKARQALVHSAKGELFDEDHDVEEDLSARLADWRELLLRHVSQARQMLRKLIVGRLVFTPREEAGIYWYEFAGQGTLANVVSGLALPKGLVAPTGFARLGP